MNKVSFMHWRYVYKLFKETNFWIKYSKSCHFLVPQIKIKMKI